jgi:hypothetical protein
MAETAYYNCTNPDTIRPYVGVYPITGTMEVFEYDHEPQFGEGLPYAAVIGPFDSIKGAHYMADHGHGNPHLQTVADAEYHANKEQS